MPLLRKGVLLPVQGVDFSKPATFIDDRNGFPTNIRFYRNELRKRPGKSVMGNITDDGSQVMGLGKLELPSLKYLVRASKKRLEKLNSATNSWDSIAATDFTGGDEDFFSFVTVTERQLLVLTNGFDSIRKWNGSGNAAVLGGNPGLAKYLTYVSPYLLLAYVTESSNPFPWKIKWCDTDDPENWSTGNAGSALVSNDASKIQQIAKLNDFVAVYKEQALYLGRKVDTSDIFIFEPIKTGIGLIAPRAWADAEGNHYFMGLNDFYVWNGIRIESIGKNARDEVFFRLDREKANRCFALHIQELTEVWFFVVINGYDWPTEIWKYNYREGYWYFDTCSQLTSAIVWQSFSSQTWDDMVGSWDVQQAIWDSGVNATNWEQVVFGAQNGYAYTLDYNITNDDGVAVNSNFVTKDFTGDTLEFNKRWLKLDVWAKGPGKLFIDYSIDEGATWVNIPANSSVSYIDMDGVYRKYDMYFDVWADKIRFRFRNAESNEVFFMRNFYPYYLSREEIRQ